MEANVLNIHQDVIDGCLAGDRSAQYRFYKLYAKAMLNICYRMLNDEDEAKDVLQDAFISAFNNFHRYKGESTIGAWLKRIVVNKALDALRKRKNSLVDNLDQEIDFVEEDDHHPQLDEGQVEQVRRAIQQLPDGFRNVLTLYLLEGYDHSEIAGILSISEGTSKSQFNRAKAKLREILERQGYEKAG